MTHPNVRTASLVGLLVSLASTSCQGAPPTATDDPFEWTVGLWEGVRRDVANGMEANMIMRVEPLLGGLGQLRTLEIEGATSVYRGTAVQQLDQDSGQWFWPLIGKFGPLGW